MCCWCSFEETGMFSFKVICWHDLKWPHIIRAAWSQGTPPNVVWHTSAWSPWLNFTNLAQGVNFKKLGSFVIDGRLANRIKHSSFLEFTPCTELVKLNPCVNPQMWGAHLLGVLSFSQSWFGECTPSHIILFYTFLFSIMITCFGKRLNIYKIRIKFETFVKNALNQITSPMTKIITNRITLNSTKMVNLIHANFLLMFCKYTPTVNFTTFFCVLRLHKWSNLLFKHNNYRYYLQMSFEWNALCLFGTFVFIYVGSIFSIRVLWLLLVH